MSDHDFYGIPVHCTNIAIPEGVKHAVKVFVEVLGPVDPTEQQLYQVSDKDLEAYVVFESTDKTPIGFALLDAFRAMPGKRLQLTGKIEEQTNFNMPTRFVAGIKAAVKALHDRGYIILADPDFLRVMQENQLNEGVFEATGNPITDEQQRRLQLSEMEENRKKAQEPIEG